MLSVGDPKPAHNKSKVADGRHFEKNWKIAISRQKFDRSLRNVARCRKVTCWMAVKIATFLKFNMAASHHVENRKIEIYK